jgi:hypothetical protein
MEKFRLREFRKWSILVRFLGRVARDSFWNSIWITWVKFADRDEHSITTVFDKGETPKTVSGREMLHNNAIILIFLQNDTREIWEDFWIGRANKGDRCLNLTRVFFIFIFFNHCIFISQEVNWRDEIKKSEMIILKQI